MNTPATYKLAFLKQWFNDSAKKWKEASVNKKGWSTEKHYATESCVSATEAIVSATSSSGDMSSLTKNEVDFMKKELYAQADDVQEFQYEDGKFTNNRVMKVFSSMSMQLDKLEKIRDYAGTPVGGELRSNPKQKIF